MARSNEKHSVPRHPRRQSGASKPDFDVSNEGTQKRSKSSAQLTAEESSGDHSRQASLGNDVTYSRSTLHKVAGVDSIQKHTVPRLSEKPRGLAKVHTSIRRPLETATSAPGIKLPGTTMDGGRRSNVVGKALDKRPPQSSLKRGRADLTSSFDTVGMAGSNQKQTLPVQSRMLNSVGEVAAAEHSMSGRKRARTLVESFKRLSFIRSIMFSPNQQQNVPIHSGMLNSVAEVTVAEHPMNRPKLPPISKDMRSDLQRSNEPAKAFDERSPPAKLEPGRTNLPGSFVKETALGHGARPGNWILRKRLPRSNKNESDEVQQSIHNLEGDHSQTLNREAKLGNGICKIPHEIRKDCELVPTTGKAPRNSTAKGAKPNKELEAQGIRPF